MALASNMALPIARRPGGARTSASKRGTWVRVRVRVTVRVRVRVPADAG